MMWPTASRQEAEPEAVASGNGSVFGSVENPAALRNAASCGCARSRPEVQEHGVARTTKRCARHLGREALDRDLEMKNPRMHARREDNGRRDPDHPAIRIWRDV